MFSVVRDGNALDLFYTPVPEPSGAALLAVGLVALRRRRSVLE
jgi:MYXO-CTERM domain-containing protein